MPSVTDKLQQFSKGEDSEGVAHHIEVVLKTHSVHHIFHLMNIFRR